MGTYVRPEVEYGSRLEATYVHCVLTDGEMNGTTRVRERLSQSDGAGVGEWLDRTQPEGKA
jgi:hypothetical protein